MKKTPAFKTESAEWSFEHTPAALVNEIVSTLRDGRKIKAKAARKLTASIAAGILCRNYENAANQYLLPSRQSVEALENFRAAALTLWNLKPDALRLIDYYEAGAVDKVYDVVEFLKSLPENLAPTAKRGRPRTRDERLELVGKACKDWQEITGEPPTCRPSDLEPGFHYVFKRIWDELTGEDLTDEALTKDINDWQNRQ